MAWHDASPYSFSPHNEVSIYVLPISDSPRPVLLLQMCPEIIWVNTSWPWPETPLPHICCSCASSALGCAWLWFSLLEEAKRKRLIQGSDLESCGLYATCWLQTRGWELRGCEAVLQILSVSPWVTLVTTARGFNREWFWNYTELNAVLICLYSVAIPLRSDTQTSIWSRYI